MDATECPVERPQKSRSSSYSGKKKRHTQKAQDLDRAIAKTGRILATAFRCGQDARLQPARARAGRRSTRGPSAWRIRSNALLSIQRLLWA